MFFTRQLAKRPKRVAGKIVVRNATQSQSGETAIDKTAFKNPKQIKVWKNAMELMKNNLANKIPKGETPFLISQEKRFFSCMISRIERERANQFAERIRANAAIHKEEFFEKYGLSKFSCKRLYHKFPCKSSNSKFAKHGKIRLTYPPKSIII